MPRFSVKSMNQLESCDEKLQVLFNTVIKYWDCTILEGHRGEVAQNKAFEEGKSKLRWPNSKHNIFPSRAVDVAPYPIDWNNRERFLTFAGFVLGIATMKGINIRWGGDWDSDRNTKDENFSDLPHFELTN